MKPGMLPDLANYEFLSVIEKIIEYSIKNYESKVIKAIISAQEAERLRIARELHDCTIQALIALLHQLERLKTKDKNSDLIARCDENMLQLKQIIKDLRSLTCTLRPALLDHCGLKMSLEYSLNELTEKHGLQVKSRLPDLKCRLLPEVEIGIFRVFQEALNNIVRHAQATVVEVNCELLNKQVILVIKDNGIGFAGLPEDLDELTCQGKLGLAGMRERINLLGGSLKFQSTPGVGTKITVILPSPL